jgi:hypothetical protein
MRAQYDDMDRKWTLPAFYLKGKELALPKIKNAKALVEEELDKRDLEFGEAQPSMRNSHYLGSDARNQAS